jgi:hypothetical protein
MLDLIVIGDTCTTSQMHESGGGKTNVKLSAKNMTPR